MSNNNGLFPLKLVDFEQYMLVDDMADYPMVIRCELGFEGTLNREHLEQALEITVQENPLLRAFIRNESGAFFWVDGSHPTIDWTSEIPEMVRINLEKEPGLRIFIDPRPEDCHIRFFIHHAVADGSGINHFVECWLGHYQTLFQGNDTKPTTELSEEKRCFYNRGRFGMNFFKYLLRPFQEFCGAIGVLEYFSHRPVALGPQVTALDDDPSPDKPLNHQFLTLDLDEDQTRQVVKTSKELRYKINDLMLAALYDACYQWLAEKMPEESDRPMRIMIPMDMRSRRKPERFVGNMVAMIFLDRRPGRYKSLKSLTWYVWLEMTAVKIMKLGLTFVHLIRHYRKRNRLRKLLRRDRSVATTILSNMGRVFGKSRLLDDNQTVTAGDARLTEYRIFPPIRPFTWLTALVITYRKKISLQITWCNQSLTQQDAEQISSRFKANMLSGFTGELVDSPE